MMRQLSLVWFCLASAFSQALGQEDIRMAYFRGGAYDIRFVMESTLFGGIGGRSAGLNGILTSIRPDATGAIRHPAALAGLRHRQLYTEVLPPVIINPANFADVDGTVEDELDENLKDYEIPKGKLEYPELNINVGQAAALGSGGAILPLRRGTLGLALYHPVGLELDVVGSGFGTLIETSKKIGDNTTLVNFAAQMNAGVNLNVGSTAFAASYGLPLSSKLTLGAGVEWMKTKVALYSLLRVDGIMLLRQEGATQGQEYVFNDPFDGSIRFEDGEQNDLNQWAEGEFRGTGWSWRVSTAFQVTPGWSLDLAYQRAPKLRMKGHYNFVQNLVPALNAEALFGDSDDDIFDVTNLNLAKPTLTKRFENPHDDELQLDLPSSITVGTCVSWGRSLFALNAVFYSGELSYQFAGYKQGIKPSQGARFATELPFPWFLSPETILLKIFGGNPRPAIQLGMGIMKGSEIKEGFGYQRSANDRTNPSIIVPSFSLGKSFRVIEGVEAGVLLFSVPATVLKVSFDYAIDHAAE